MTAAEDTWDDLPALLASDRSTGAPGASVLLIEYGDYECPACIEAEPLTRHLLDTYGAALRFIYRHFPLSAVHPHAELAAEAAEAAAAQDRFWPMHRLLYGHRHSLESGDLARLADQAGLDMHRYRQEMTERRYRERVQEHVRSGELIGLRGSPSFFLNGRVLDVSFGMDRLEKAVQADLGLH